MIQTLENIHDHDDDKPIPLTVELFGELLKRGYRQTDIVKYTRQKKQNVSRFYKKHYEELHYLKDNQDNLAGMGFKRIMYHGQMRQLNILTDDKEVKKVSCSQAAVATGIAHQNYRLATDKSTQNIDVHSVINNIDDLEKQEKLIEARIKELSSGANTPQDEHIEIGNGECTP